MTPYKISLIIPCYNEEAVIEKTYNRVTAVFEKNFINNYEIIFINDGSLDKTIEILEKFAFKDKNIKIINFSRNFGHQPAVSAGIKLCAGDIAVIIDADLQDPPELIPDMINIYEKEKANVVYGVRKIRNGEGFFKLLTAKLFYRLINSLSEVKLPVDAGDFRLMDRKVINCFKNFSEKNKYIRGLISWVGFKQVPFYYSRDKRAAGETKYPVSKMLKFAATGLLYFTKKPLKIALTLGFLSILIGLGLTVYVFFAKFSNLIQTVPGWASTIISVVFFGGVQLLTIGVLGEYIGSIFDEVKGRPEYIIDSTINFKEY